MHVKDRTKLFITGVAALGVLASTVGAHRLFLGGWSHDRHNDRGGAQRNLAELRDFDGISVTGPFEVIVVHGDRFSVETKGDSDAAANVDLQVRGRTLMIAPSPHRGWDFGRWDDVTVHVTLPSLSRVSLTGSGDVTVDAMTGKDVTASLTGSGDLAVKGVAAARTDVRLTGSGNLDIAGTTGATTARLAGSGVLDAEGLKSETVDATVAGSGDVRARAARSAALTLNGSGSAIVEGTGNCTVRRNGSGDARCDG
jgi:hypothetical protein